MKFLKVGALVLVTTLVVLVLIAPIGPLPGFFIGGTATAAPLNWQDTSGIDEIELKVPGMLPRVVIIWVVEHAGELYVVGASNSGWVTMLNDGASVDMRLGDNTYTLRAKRINTGWEPILTAYVDKYRADYPEIIESFPPIEEARGTVAVFQLQR